MLLDDAAFPGKPVLTEDTGKYQYLLFSLIITESRHNTVPRFKCAQAPAVCGEPDSPVSQGHWERGLETVGQSTLRLTWQALLSPLLLIFFPPFLNLITFFLKQDEKKGK